MTQAIPFILAGDFVCKNFLPDQEPGRDGLVCGEPVPEGRRFSFCVECGKRLLYRAKALPGRGVVVLGKRKMEPSHA